MKTKYILFGICLLMAVGLIGALTSLRAQEEQNNGSGFIFQAMKNVTIHQDSSITQLMEDHWVGRVRGEEEMPGWRLQVYSSNGQLQAKQEAEQLKEMLEKEITEPVYVIFTQPFWKVRIGNFRTVEEVKAYKEVLLEQFPDLHSSAYPVKDIIIIQQ
ncbi:MAG: SPOR domain-containing protein [Bacteroidales bacterium]|nr:SPOR domain-containing protein [Bacteroidales bacterium]